MKRFIEENLSEWAKDSHRKPLLLTGARQVGKSYVIEKNLATSFPSFVKINFEKQPEFQACFNENLSPQNILPEIEALANQKIIPGTTLLFLDEIQLCPRALTALRYFYEDLPSLHIIAAGSLLGFAIEKLSIPVGRLTFRHLTPLSLEEYLINAGEKIFLETLQNHSIEKPLPDALHQKGLTLLKDYMALGGLPEVVDHFQQTRDYRKCQDILRDLLEGYRRDFPKYGVKDTDLKYIDLVFDKAPHLVGKVVKYVEMSRDIQSKYLQKGINHLVKADILHPVYKTTTVPLAAQCSPGRFKLNFLDIGLMQKACGLGIKEWITQGIRMIHSGALAEQFAGQQILAHNHFTDEPLYYWERDQPNSSAEVDYVIEKNQTMLPIEVKSGTEGKLRSLHLFLKEKNLPLGLKISMDNYGRNGLIQSIPLYGLGTWLK